MVKRDILGGASAYTHIIDLWNLDERGCPIIYAVGAGDCNAQAMYRDPATGILEGKRYIKEQWGISSEADMRVAWGNNDLRAIMNRPMRQKGRSRKMNSKPVVYVVPSILRNGSILESIVSATNGCEW
jgi:hypothetical protein